MKRILLAFLFVLFLSTICFAQDTLLARGMVVGSGAAAGCSASTEYAGYNQYVVDTNEQAIGKGYAFIFGTTASCSGPLNTANLYGYHYGSASTAIVCIYAKANTDPSDDSAQSLIATSGTITYSANAWNTSAMTTTPNVTASNAYWVMIVIPTTAENSFSSYYSTDGSAWYQNLSATACPATLGTGWNESALHAPISAYITIGE